ncbi:hypothetical protein [Photobacterium galatheae]|uniref:Beta-ketoacyl synthase N-terminal domain-containing protein n=1 Tax=Photobacterium galatheae TaxID=1654360 RepID=A0A066RL76_9GAMM|nr:hypothetical protein [Photobacterium galatheae]KDM91099.1 hypothetical protein EA58_13175 [Photobacterium galatheae]MCM0150181.1 hypothetical protein [Photobacterium galatheae]
MSSSSARYVLCADAVTAAGFNLDVSVAVARASLDMYETRCLGEGDEKATVAPVTYLDTEESETDRMLGMLTLLVNQLTVQLPGSLSAVPLYVRMPESVTQRLIDEWLTQLQQDEDSQKTISRVVLSHASGHQHFSEVQKALNDEEVLIAVSVDSPMARLNDLAEQQWLQTNQHPWGVIASEGAGGAILASRSFVEAMKIKPLAALDNWCYETGESTHLMSRVLRRQSKAVDDFGLLFSDMTNLRHHQEDYGFAVGARGERLVNPEQIIVSHTLWGYLGDASLFATLALAVHHQDQHFVRSLFLFGADSGRAMLTLSLSESLNPAG